MSQSVNLSPSPTVSTLPERGQLHLLPETCVTTVHHYCISGTFYEKISVLTEHVSNRILNILVQK